MPEAGVEESIESNFTARQAGYPQMKQTKKIYITKSDSLASIVGKIVKAREEEIVLYIPRGTEFAASRTNFILLKREVATAGKKVVIESIDEDALELADTAGVKAVNPFLRRRQRAVSDIVAVVPQGLVEGVPKAEKTRTEESPPAGSDGDAETSKKQKKEREEKEEAPERTKITPKRVLVYLGSAALAALIFTGLTTVLPRAEIELNMEKKNLDFVGMMIASADIKENSFSRDEVSIRGVSFLEKKNITKAYPASGKNYVERKATGEIVIYNNFSSAPQNLVATTRFAAPDGKIYRLNNTITVPGATGTAGKLVSSSIRALVTADKAGEEYNLSPGARFRIPGFEGSPKYEGFHAELKGSISGGFVGESSLPSEEDINSARADAEKSLEEVLKTQLLFNLPPEVKILDNAYQFKVSDTRINETANEENKFTITVYGETKLIGFREAELVEVIGKGLIAKSGNDFKPENYELEYGDPVLSPDGVLKAPIKFKSVWTRTFDSNQFKSEAAGKKQADLQALVSSIPGIQSGEARLWPFWVRNVPKDIDRIILDVK